MIWLRSELLMGMAPVLQQVSLAALFVVRQDNSADGVGWIDESRPSPRRPVDFFREIPDEFDALDDRGGRVIMLGDGTETSSDSEEDMVLPDEVEEKDDEVLETVPPKETKGIEGAGDVSNNLERDKENTKIDSTPKGVGTQHDEEGLTKESTAAK